MAYVLAVAIYIAMGLYRWRLDRQSIDRQGLAGILSETLILGTLVNFIVWIAFSRH